MIVRRVRCVRGVFRVPLAAIPLFLFAWTPADPAGASAGNPALGTAERVECLERIERVLWSHRIWPDANPGPRPAPESRVDRRALAARVRRDLAADAELARRRGHGISAGELQAELERMARASLDRKLLGELFDALDRDPLLAAECLARPALTARLLSADAALQLRIESRARAGSAAPPAGAAAIAGAPLALPDLPAGACTLDTWTPLATPPNPSANARVRPSHVWTGTEMIVWGGTGSGGVLLTTGLRYTPALDSWQTISIAGAPTGRYGERAVWTGSEMIVWGGAATGTQVNTGGRYSPGSDSWTATPTSGAPSAREGPAMVWSGSEVIVWGGRGPSGVLGDGRRFSPSIGLWSPMSAASAPAAREYHAATWTGSRILVWGGRLASASRTNTGASYDPVTDTWAAISTTSAPSPRDWPLMAWTGDEAVVWGGSDSSTLATGGIYSPVSDSWTATSTVAAPAPRHGYNTPPVASDQEFIVWGNAPTNYNDGGRLDPEANAWTPMSPAPSGRQGHANIWTGEAYLVWGGSLSGTVLADGAAYCAPSDTAAPTGPANFLALPPHFEFGWATDPNLTLEWSGAADAGGSGLEGYVVLVDGSANTDPGTTVNVPHTADPHDFQAVLPSGQSYAHLRVCDEAGNCGAPLHAGPYGLDQQAPSALSGLTSTTHAVGVPSNVAVIATTWDPGSDVPSGVAGYVWTFTSAPSWTCAGPILGTPPGATSNPLVSGTWYFHVCAADYAGNPGPVATLGPFLLDHEGAQVTAVGSVADSGDGQVAAGELLVTGPTQLLLEFTEPLDPLAAEDEASYLVVGAGANGILETSGCLAGPGGDDVAVPVDLATFSSAPAFSALRLDGRRALPLGGYRSFGCSALEDLAGNALDGDGLPGNGEDFALDFAVRATNLLENPNFDGDLGGWQLSATGSGVVAYAAADADGHTVSGSAGVSASPSGPEQAGFDQCVTLAAGVEHLVDGSWTVTGGDAFSPELVVTASFFASATCGGVPLSTSEQLAAVGTTSAAWIPFASRLVAPAGAVAARLGLSVRAASLAAYQAKIDRLVFDDGGIFADGFESGDWSRWSSSWPP